MDYNKYTTAEIIIEDYCVSYHNGFPQEMGCCYDRSIHTVFISTSFIGDDPQHLKWTILHEIGHSLDDLLERSYKLHYLYCLKKGLDPITTISKYVVQEEERAWAWVDTIVPKTRKYVEFREECLNSYRIACK